MALDFLSAPGQVSINILSTLSDLYPTALSVDAKHALSGGQLQVNHLQHGMSSQTFKAQVALGSWIGSPIFPTTDPFITMVEDRMKRERKPKDQAPGADVKVEDENEYISSG